MDTLDRLEVPLAGEKVAYAKNWLVQHIRNTDFRYRGNLLHQVPEPYLWKPDFSVEVRE